MHCFTRNAKLLHALFGVLLAFAGGLRAQGPDTLSGDLSLDSLLSIRIASASKYEQVISEVPASVTLLTADDIRDHGFTDLLEALQVMRSVFISNDRNYAFIGVRGFSRPTDYTNKVLFMVDGVPINDNVWGAVNVASDYLTMDLSQVERIELIRGASSSLYGSYAMLAVINVVMKDGRTLDGGSASVGVGSYGRAQASANWGTRTAGGLDVAVGGRFVRTGGQALHYPEYDTCATCTGVADHLDGGMHVAFSGKLKYKGLEVKGFFTERRAGVATGSYGTIFGSDLAKVHDRQSFLDVTYTRELDDTKALTVKTYLQNVYYAQAYPYTVADGGLGHDHSDGIWTTSEARFRWDLFTNNRLVVGGEWQQHYRAEHHTQNEFVIYADSNYPYFAWSGYVQDEYQPLRWLSFTAGGRFDRNYGGKRAFTPRVTALVNPFPTSTVKLIWGRAFRAPNISELLLRDGFSYIGNPDLTPEYITTAEVAWEQRIGKHFLFNASVYRFRMDDLVDKVTRPTDSLDSYDNIGTAVANGVEAELIARTQKGARAYLSATYQKVADAPTNALLSNSPCYILRAGGATPLLRHFHLATDLSLEDRRLTVYNTYTPTAFLWNANLIFRPDWQDLSGVRKALSHASISLRANNILNSKIYHPGGFEHLQPAILQNGRNFVLKLTWNY